MAMELVQFKVRGIAPLILHNGLLADPLNKWTKAIASLTARGTKKTDATIMEIGRLEWFGGLYTNEDNRIIMPDFVIEAAIVSGAKRSRLGTAFKSAIFVTQHAELDLGRRYKSLEDLYEDETTRDRRLVGVNSNRVPRTRPIFRNWQADWNVQYDSDQVNFANLLKSVQDAGAYCGVGDYRPRYGRFEVVSHNTLK